VPGFGRDYTLKIERVLVPKSQPTTFCFSIFSALNVRGKQEREAMPSLKSD